MTLSTPRGRVFKTQRAVPPRLPSFVIPDEFIEQISPQIAWREIADGYRQGKLDL